MTVGQIKCIVCGKNIHKGYHSTIGRITISFCPVHKNKVNGKHQELIGNFFHQRTRCFS